MYGVDDVKPLLDLYLSMLRSHFGGRLVSAAVYGSVARGEARPESDIDLLLVVEGLPFYVDGRVVELSRVKAKLRSHPLYWEFYERNLPRHFSEVALTPEEVERHPPILLDICVEGVILVDKGGFLQRQLDELRRRLEELGARRERGREGWYWVLKPDVKFGEVIKL